MANVTIKNGYGDHHDDENNWHVYPLYDTREHITDRKHDCFCEPTVVKEIDRRIFIHPALDGRE